MAEATVVTEQRVQLFERLMTELLGVTDALARTRSRDEVARVLVECAPRSLAASAVALWAVEGHQLRLLSATESQRELLCPYATVDLASDIPLAVSVRTQREVFLGSVSEHRATFPASLGRIEAVRSPADAAFAIVPLVDSGKALGAVCFTFSSERRFEDAERTYLTLIARHASLALTRVTLLEIERAQHAAAVEAASTEKQARSDVELLYELIASFDKLDDTDAVYELALASAQRGSRSDRAAILLFDDAGVMRFRAWSGLSARYRDAVDGHSPWKPDDSFPRPIAVDDVTTDPAWASYRDVFAQEGIRALAFVPIVHQRKLIGKFMLYRDQPRAFAARDLQLTATVAVHVAQAADRKQQERELARAYREEREAHLLAEEATRAREEILSVVSHDLRNPLGAIVMGVSTLLAASDTPPPARVRLTAERVQRQAERMTRLIEDLVDFAGIQAGKLALQRGRHAPEAILLTTSDIFGPIASERGLELRTSVHANLPPIDCDSDRAVQVMSNLVSNALKVTPKGGAIEIGAQSEADAIVFYVRDNGPGIAPDELPRLFERYWRGRQTSYRGTGLGLSIARGIVDAHGGRIWAESIVGAGSTFFFCLGSSLAMPVRTLGG